MKSFMTSSIVRWKLGDRRNDRTPSRSRGIRSWGLSLTTLLATVLVLGSPGRAVQLRDGMVYFVGVPQLLESVTSSTAADVWSPTYSFTIKLPDNAGEPLQKMTIAPAEGVDHVRFLANQVRAFVGTRRSQGQSLSLGDVTVNSSDGTLTVNFDPPVAPGQVFTIEVVPRQNPSVEGVYLLSVTAFPQGEKSHGQFLGYARFNIYRHGGGFWRRWH